MLTRQTENLAKADSTILQLDQRILVIALQNANLREKFYRELHYYPVKFIENWPRKSRKH